MRSGLVLLQLALVGQACALLVAPRPCSWHAACSEAGRSSSPLMLAKRKGKASRGKASRGSSSTPPGDTPPPAAAPEPAGLDVEAAMAQAEAAAAEAAAAKARLAAARARAAAAAKQQAEAAPVAPVAPEPTPFVMAPPDAPFPVAGPADVADRASFDEKGAIIRDEPKQALPSFESYSRGGLCSRACPYSAPARAIGAVAPPSPILSRPSAPRSAQEAATKAQRVRGQAVREQAARDQPGVQVRDAGRGEGREGAPREARLQHHMGPPLPTDHSHQPLAASPSWPAARPPRLLLVARRALTLQCAGVTPPSLAGRPGSSSSSPLRSSSTRRHSRR